MAVSIFNELGELVGERERALQTICHLVDESGEEPGPGFWVDVERMHTSELYVRIRKLAEKTIVDEHAKWSDLVVLAFEEMQERTTVGTPSQGDEILAAVDRMKAAAVRTAREGSTVDAVMNHIYGTPQKTQAGVRRDFPKLAFEGIQLLSGFRGDYTNN